MRYFVLCESIEPGTDPYILAEVVRAPGDEKELSLAASLAGARAQIQTRVELIKTVEGRRALELWDARDDSTFDHETAALERVSRRSGGTRLRVVDVDDRDPPRVGRRLPRDPERREIIVRARGLREITRALVQDARARRIERAESVRHSDASRGDG